jgi:asparagine synthase (glutamine-hydrolysing)
LVFGSELKALRAHPDFSAKINAAGMAQYFSQGMLGAPHTIHENIWILPPGQCLSLPLGQITPGEDLSNKALSYWDPLRVMRQAHQSPIKGTDSDIIERFETLLEECVTDRMLSDVPLGAFLSGGIDSSTIVALMQKNSLRPIKTYSIGFSEEGFDEAAYARPVAAHLGTDHQDMILDSQTAARLIPELCEFYDEPFADYSSIPTYLVARLARQQVTVALSGDGGDEMLGGYNRHQLVPKLWGLMRPFPFQIRNIAANLLQTVPAPLWNNLRPGRADFGRSVHKMADVLRGRGPEDIYKTLLNPFGVSVLQDKTLPVLPTRLTAAMGQGQRSEIEDMSLNITEKIMLWDTLSYLPDDILTKVDRATMAVSLESRAPLLDYRIFEFAWRLPMAFKVRAGKGKWLLRKVLARHVAPMLFERPKQGFTVPMAAWLRGDLKPWASDLLAQRQLYDDVLDTAMVERLWEQHQARKADHGVRLWTIFMFIGWRQRWG